MSDNWKKLLVIIFAVISILAIALFSGCDTTTTKKVTPFVEPIQPITSTKPGSKPTLDDYSISREVMVSTQIEARGIRNINVLQAMRIVPRHEFIPERYIESAYNDSPLPIDHGQTISQPFIVALMTEMLEVESGNRVLEIGTGSGYQAAVLAEMGVDVYSVEIITELAEEAESRLHKLGYQQVKVLNKDGYFGWDTFGPYDAIIVTAAPDHLPQPLIKQLKEGGRLVIPIGPIGAVQTLWLFEVIDGEIQAINMGAVRFVPLTGDH